ncbi:hypothetical protein [Paraburkholderia sp. 40]|uniref:hypothetical protein n=1 Tax=Paraburkholderia sp. 40 TaxID=2991059 RepID=UPI003D191C51
MKNIQIEFGLAIIYFYSAAAYAEGMCNDNEMIVFNCQSNRSTASLCKEMGGDALTYRHGKMNRIDLEVSAVGLRKKEKFYFSSIPYSGGGEAHIRFFNGGYTYFLYDKTVRVDEGPEFSSGIVVYRHGRKISQETCNNDASIQHAAYSEIKKEEYMDIGSK